MRKLVSVSRELSLANQVRRSFPDLLAGSVPLVLDNLGWIRTNEDLAIDPFREDQVIRPPWDKVWVEMKFNRDGDLDHEEGWLIRRGDTEGMPAITEWLVDRYGTKSGARGKTLGYSLFIVAETGVGCRLRCRRGTQAQKLHIGDDAAHVAAVLALPFLAFALLHSRCVRALDVLPILTRQQLRKSLRTREPILRYKILHVPNGDRPPSSSVHASIRDRFPIPLHLVRGHFARYTEERPLFGRLVGTFFKRAHLRGTAAAGAVAKTYDVQTEGAKDVTED